LNICTSPARLTRKLKLVPDIFSKFVPLYQAAGTQANVAKIPFQIERSNSKDLSSVCLHPHGLVQKGRIY